MQRLYRMENKQKKKYKKLKDVEESTFEIEFYKEVPVVSIILLNIFFFISLMIMETVYTTKSKIEAITMKDR